MFLLGIICPYHWAIRNVEDNDDNGLGGVSHDVSDFDVCLERVGDGVMIIANDLSLSKIQGRNILVLKIFRSNNSNLMAPNWSTWRLHISFIKPL